MKLRKKKPIQVQARNRAEVREALRQNGTRAQRKATFGQWRKRPQIVSALRVQRIAERILRTGA